MTAPDLSRSVARAFYGSRTGLREAQQRAIEPLLAGRDALVIAGTGSGKTEAVVAPVVDCHLSDAHALDGKGVTYLYLSPTKALANDMAARLEGPLESIHLTVGRRHGDNNDLGRVRAPDLLITTPESLDIELVKQQPRYRSIRAVVIDEVHQLVSTQRGLQLAVLLERLERWLERTLQVAGMSATLADPLASWEQMRPGRPCDVIEVEGRRERSVVLRREQSEQALVELLAQTSSKGKVLVFARSRGETEALAAGLGECSPFGRRVYVHHSSLDRRIREQVELDLKGKDATLCAATSTLELGIDIGDINLVVLVGPPPDWRSLEQRIGRTNRRGDRTDVIGVVPPLTKLPLLDLCYFLGLISQIDRKLPRRERPARLYGALAQQAVSMVRQGGDWSRVSDLSSVLATAPGVRPDDVLEILERLVEADVLARHPVRNMLGSGPELEQILENGEAWSNFPAGSQSFQLYENDRRLGEVPFSGYNLKLLQPGNLVAFKGRTLRVERVVRRYEVRVKTTTGKALDKLRFGGAGPVRDPYLVGAVPRVLSDPHSVDALGRRAAGWWEVAAPHVLEGLGDGLPVWRGAQGVGHATFAGVWINNVLAELSGGGSAGEAVVHLDRALDPSSLPAFDELDTLALGANPEAAGLTTWQRLLPPALLAAEVLDPWHHDPIYRQTWKRLRTSSLAWTMDDRLSALG
jgi:ATP-dependent Lhr-like helicase